MDHQNSRSAEQGPLPELKREQAPIHRRWRPTAAKER